jgi:hypothetical protein
VGFPAGPQSSPVPARILPVANQAPHKTEGLPRRLADDSTIYSSAKTIEELNVIKLTHDMSNVHTWCTNNNMVINNSKTKAMVMTTYQRAATLNSNLHVQFNGVKLTNTENEKLLGVIVNNNLCWKLQIDKVARSLNKGIHLLRQIKEYLPICFRVLYY